ncbi:zinc finger domain-containing protein [Streptomyces fulvorobeus]|uniref:zinc finger domain-containing protein n=1 Tax=Streptomyces fulvorobeus TaxID=284028 RepID=UPI003CD07E34
MRFRSVWNDAEHPACWGAPTPARPAARHTPLGSGRPMDAEDEPRNTTWGGQGRRSLRSGPELDLVRSWNRRIECPTCKAVAGRACRTEGGHPTNHHRARRDAAGPLPYEKWRQQGLIPPPRIYTMPNAGRGVCWCAAGRLVWGYVFCVEWGWVCCSWF